MVFCQVNYNNGAVAIDLVDINGIHTTLAKADSYKEAFAALSKEDQDRLISAVTYKVDRFETCIVIWSSIIS